MPSHLKRYQSEGHFHAINFSCYRHHPYLQDERACIVFEEALERVRTRHDFFLFGYVLMPDHAPCCCPSRSPTPWQQP